MNTKRIVFHPVLDDGDGPEAFPEYETDSLTACILLTQSMNFSHVGMFSIQDDGTRQHTGFDFGYHGRALREKTCPECDGNGEIPVLYCDGYHPELSNEQAARLAGEVYRTVTCPQCEGEGEVYE